jgi:hypothetical protein
MAGLEKVYPSTEIPLYKNYKGRTAVNYTRIKNPHGFFLKLFPRGFLISEKRLLCKILNSDEAPQ